MATLRRTDRVREAILDFEALIRGRYPKAEFRTVKGFDPAGTYLEVIVPNEEFSKAFAGIFDTIEDRLVELMDDGPLALFVMPVPEPAPVS